MPRLYSPRGRAQTLGRHRTQPFEQGRGVAINAPDSGGGGALLAQATAALGGVQPLHYWDFTTNRALFNRNDVGAVANTPGWTFGRASEGTYDNVDGSITTFAAGQPRRAARGLLLENGRTNLFLNSAVGVTQTCAVLTGNFHSISFRGTGTITLSDAFVGSVVGTGVNNTVFLNFLTITTSLTLTVTGDVRNVNLEMALSHSTWIPTAGTAMTRLPDVATIASYATGYPLTMFVEFERSVDSGVPSLLLRVDDGTLPNRSILGIFGTTDQARLVIATAGVTEADILVGAALTPGPIYKQAGSFNTNRAQIALNTTLGVEDTVVTPPPAPTVLRFGSSELGLDQPYVYMRRAAIFNSAVNDAQLQAMTT